METPILLCSARYSMVLYSTMSSSQKAHSIGAVESCGVSYGKGQFYAIQIIVPKLGEI